MDITQPHTLNLSGVLTTSKRIILTRYTHFITLSLFFLPLSISLIITPTLTFINNPSNHHKLPPSYLLYTLTVNVLALCAIATITYSTHHAFFGEFVKISDSLKSLIFSFFPLAWTAIVAYVLIVLISLIFLTLVGAVLMLVRELGFVVIDYNSIYFMWFSIAVGVVLIAIVMYVHVEWSLAFVVVVVESKWGFEALMRSSYLVKGMRSVSLFVMLYFGVFGAGIVWMCDIRFVLVTMLGSFFIMVFLLRIAAANTVLYNYCKALHGELVIEVAEGFGYEYVDLVDDGEKVPYVVGVVAA